MSRKRYPIRIPKCARGIRMQETRQGAGRSWWAREWAAALEAMGMGARLGRGRNYARGGQVVALAVDGGRVTASVVGTRDEPYEVHIDFRQPDEATRARLIEALRREPILVARLLADDLPLEVADIFRAEGFSLFPGTKLGPRRYDVTSSCSCPDYANPCKHAAAVFLVFGEEVARRPSVLLEVRGINLEELVK